MTQDLSNQRRDHQKFFTQIKAKSDRIIDFVMAGYFLNGIFLSWFYDTWIVGFCAGALCLLAYYGAKLALPKARLYQYVASVVFGVFMAQFIYQMHGMFEMHFFVFIASVLLITYQEWKLFIPLALVVLLHHTLFAWLQYSGMEEAYFTQLQYMDLQTFFFHAALAVVFLIICAYWSHDLSGQTIQGGLMREKMQRQISTMEQNIRFAEDISKGNLQIDYQLAEADDELGKALLNMRQSLLEASIREQQERFVNVGIARLGDILRNHLNNLQELSDKVLYELVHYLKLNQAGLFLVEEADDQKPVLRLISSYAYNRKKFQEKEFAIGQGLVGQAYLERDFIYMTDVPQGFTTITSGLGEATPGSILIMPLMVNEEVVGVLEVASIKAISQGHIQFLEKAAQSLASTILSARGNAKTSSLLAQAQEQAEIMRAQEEEMRQNMEEMEATQEEVRRQSSAFEKIIAEKDAEMARLQNQLQLN